MLPPFQEKLAARLGKDETDQGKRAVDIDVERPPAGHAMHDADASGVVVRLNR